jgi:glycerol-3-phosphate dehydrogenase
MAIAEYVVALLESVGLELTERSPLPKIPNMSPLGENQLRRYEDRDAIAVDAEYGSIICHCERVTRGEIRDACIGDLPAREIGALRRRTRAMNGRCQGFYCAAEVVSLLAELTSATPAVLTGLTE